MRPVWDTERVVTITVDLDWASEAAVAYAQAMLERHQLSATYFVTHASATVDELVRTGRAASGIHPNFLADSSHGRSFAEVIDHCLALVPGVRCFRSHRYFDVTDITHALYARGCRYDANVCSFLEPGLRPFRHESGLVRFPTYFEDGTYLYHRRTLRFADVAPALFDKPGLMVLSFHPTDLALNAPDLQWLRREKDSRSRAEWNTLSASALAAARHSGRGIADFAEDMMAHIRAAGLHVYALDELYEQYGKWAAAEGRE
jgi:hypothetical protein